MMAADFPSISDSFDLIVIGGGPAGYVAAIRAAQLKMKVACIEKRKVFGGTCLNVGCIPSKALLDSSEHYYQAKTKFHKHGIKLGEVTLDLPQMMRRKEKIVEQLGGGVSGLFKKNKVQGIFGQARLLGVKNGFHEVEVESEGKKTIFTTKKILLATGSEPTDLPFFPFDGKDILSSTEALMLDQVPKHLCVIGGGAIGLELGSVWLRLGAKVTVIEYADRICPLIDKQIGTQLHQALSQQGMQFQLSTQCMGGKKTNQGWEISLKNRETQEQSSLLCDKVLIAIGRRPYSKGLGLKECGVSIDKAGRVEVDPHFQTNVSGVYAIGDLIAGPMLAHKAEEEGIAAVEKIAGQAGHINYKAIPNVIYTWPEVATVGETQEELEKKGIPHQTGTFPFLANGRAKTMDEAEGMVKVIAHATTNLLLGVHIVGPWASDLIAEAVSVMEFGGSAEDIARTCHAHPTLSEALKEASMGVSKRQIHF